MMDGGAASSLFQKKDKYRREGKGQFPTALQRYCALGRFEEQDKFIHSFIHPVNRVAFIQFFKIVLVQNSWRGKELNYFCPPNSRDDLCLFFCIYPPSMLPVLHLAFSWFETKDKIGLTFCFTVQVSLSQIVLFYSILSMQYVFFSSVSQSWAHVRQPLRQSYTVLRSNSCHLSQSHLNLGQKLHFDSEGQTVFVFQLLTEA